MAKYLPSMHRALGAIPRALCMLRSIHRALGIGPRALQKEVLLNQLLSLIDTETNQCFTFLEK